MTAAFDVCGDLPRGVTVLEASAGTGKTFTIAALAARYVAEEGVPLEQLLLVTFTRIATGELRERVRERLAGAERGLARAVAGAQPPAGDAVLARLARGTTEERELRRRRLATALADFDAALIATTHGFCQHILSGLGVSGDVERDRRLISDPGELVAEVVDDLYVRRFHWGDAPRFGRDEALRIGRIAVNNPLARIVPAGAPPDTDRAMRQRLACAVRDEVERRKQRTGQFTYDDLLTRLASTLGHPVHGPAACRRLRQRYRVALVDEFQDTDPVQWEILRRAFADAGSTPTAPESGRALVLIGDPKQAIYAFRGADVYAYLEAKKAAGTTATLTVNWRSDQGLVDAYDALFRGARLGHAGIAYTAVRAADAHAEPGLAGAPCALPLRVRVVHRGDGPVQLTPKGYVNKQSGQAHIAADLAADLVGLLSAGATVAGRDVAGPLEPVRPGHVAVLVRMHRQAALVRDALEAAGIPAVINGAGSVLGTPTARQWLQLLEALERPSSSVRARAAALTPFLGWTAERVALADDATWEDVHARLYGWAAMLRQRGVASLLEMITLTEGLPARMLARQEGERALTDLRHVGQLLHAEAVSERLGVTALTAWLRQRIAEAGADTGTEERSRRLESDAEAVQVLTIHRSKGLEFPIVYYPFLWEAGWIPDDEPPVFHDQQGRRTIDVGMGGPDFRDHRNRFVDEQRGEDLRLAYVALTRARHQAVVWWAASWDSRNSPLGRLLFARDDSGNVATHGPEPPEDPAAAERFAALSDQAPGCVSVERTSAGTGAVWTRETPVPGDLDVRRFNRALDAHWRRTSYSGITFGAHEATVSSEPDEAGLADEGLPVQPGGMAAALPGDGGDPRRQTAGQRGLRAVPLLLGAMPGGAAVGTFVHAVLERTDFSAGDLDAELATRIDEQRAWRPLEIGEGAALVAGLRAALETPLGPLAGEARLRDIGRADRLDELGFELPLAGGDVPTAALTIDAVAQLLRAHVPAGDVLAGYADRLRDPALQRDLRGYLTGSVDAVLRLRDDGAQRFAVVDYKTNWLGRDGAVGGDSQELSAWHYRPAALADAMQRAHYPLQGLLYTVALHRYLRWRLPGYDPARNLAGMLYLFVRGMTGATAPRVQGQPCGVFAWRPPPALVSELSDLLDRGPEAASASSALGRSR